MMVTSEDYTTLYKSNNREVRRYVFVLKNSEYTEKKVATRITMNAPTELNLWIGESGNVIGLDFLQIFEGCKKQ